MAELDKGKTDSLEELMLSTLAMTDALAMDCFHRTGYRKRKLAYCLSC